MHDGIMRHFALIDEMKSSSFKSVLDIGGLPQSHKNFFPKVRFTILNLTSPKKYKDNKFVKGSVLKIPFKNNTFDLIVSSDMMEHILRKNRKKAIDEIIRVSSKKIILVFPCGKKSQSSEKIVLFVGKFFGRKMRWLSEHKECGLPMISEIEQIINSNKKVKSLEVKQNFNICLWLLFSLISPMFRIALKNVNRTKLYKNWNWFFKLFSFGTGYRGVFIIDLK